MKKIGRRNVKIAISLGVIIYASVQLGKIMYDNYYDRRASAMVQEIYYEAQQQEEILEEEEGTAKKKEQKHVREKFLPLLEINPDVVGWLTVEDLAIDYPLVQASDNDFYLDKNFNLETSKAGSIFVDFRNEVNELGKHTILYGHRMKDGSMFGNLDQLLQLQEGKKFIFETLYERYEAEIFSVYKTTTDFYYIETDFENEEHYGEFLEVIKAKSLLELESDLQQSDQILTLSTCDYELDRHEGRLVVHAKLSKLE